MNAESQAGPLSLRSRTWRRFGSFGPAYRIDAIVGMLDDGDTVYRVERLCSEILGDPEER